MYVPLKHSEKRNSQIPVAGLTAIVPGHVRSSDTGQRVNDVRDKGRAVDSARAFVASLGGIRNPFANVPGEMSPRPLVRYESRAHASEETRCKHTRGARKCCTGTACKPFQVALVRAPRAEAYHILPGEEVKTSRRTQPLRSLANS